MVGTAYGPLLLYNWDEFAAPSDRFPGHPGSVDCFAKVSEDVLCTASSDGMIRYCLILFKLKKWKPFCSTSCAVIL